MVKMCNPFILFLMLICFFPGKIIVHALDEKAREYYNLEGLWTTETSQKEPNPVIWVSL